MGAAAAVSIFKPTPSLTIKRFMNSISSSGSVGLGFQAVRAFRASVYSSLKPRWEIYISTSPLLLRSKRVRNLSRNPVSDKLLMTLPKYLRMKSWGNLARFSAHSVSRMPNSCWSKV